MAPNKKKKRSAANPARGFATKSLPSKTKTAEAEASAQDVNAQVDLDAASDGPHHTQSQSAAPQSGSENIQQMTPEQLEAHLELSELRALLDNHGSRCRQEVSWQVSRLDSERRQLRSPGQSHRLAASGWLTDLNLASLVAAYRDRMDEPGSHCLIGSGIVDDGGLILRLWTLQRTLIALGFSDADPVIRHVLMLSGLNQVTKTDYIWGLPEAFEWYALHRPSTDLPTFEKGVVAVGEETVRLDDEEESTVQHNESSDGLLEPADANSTLDNDQEVTMPELSSLSESASDDEDPDLLVTRYFRLQTRLFRTEEALKLHAARSLATRKANILEKVERISRDPLFDKDAAQESWRLKEQELIIESRKDQRWGRESASKSAHRAEESGAVKEGEQAMEDLGGFFEMHNVEGDEHVDGEPKTVKVLDFGIWSGTQPKVLMEECCRLVDAETGIRFTVMAKSLASCRQNVRIVMSRLPQFDRNALASIPTGITYLVQSRSIVLKMETVATTTPAQAESYLSCVVLFLLATAQHADFRQYTRLPTTWRNFYHDLVEKRTALDNEEDLVMLRKLRLLIDQVRGQLDHADTSTLDLSSLSFSHARATTHYTKPQTDKATETQVKDIWNAKSSTPAFQQFLRLRARLPVYEFKEQILEAIEHHPLVIICADTGAGKSTQVPAFILERTLSQGRDRRILVTQPRRISAISLARRVSQELGEFHGDLGTAKSLLGYAIRLESRTSQSTRITFATTGVLLRMFESSSDLAEIDYLILDEVHERTMDLDLLFIAIRRLQERRDNLRVILMSATVDAQKFSTYFRSAPVLAIPGRTFPVQVKYLEDAVEETLEMRNSVTNESNVDSDAHSEESTDTASPTRDTSIVEAKGQYLRGYSARTRSILAAMDQYRIDYELVANLVEVIASRAEYVPYSKAILIFMPGMAEIRRLHSVIQARATFVQGWVIHLLHSSFTTEELERAFAVPTGGQRKIVVSTNIAETGITIPDVTAVIDTCKEKVMRFNERRQLSKLTEGFISRSSARQRKGRSARVQEGLCFHLVTRERYDEGMPEQHVPEMLRGSLQDPILRIKIWNLGSIEETLAAAIDPPTIKNIRRAIERLREAGALSSKDDLTPLGKLLARLPLGVVLGKMALFSLLFRCLDAIVTIIAFLTSKNPFLGDKLGPTSRHQAFDHDDSDLLTGLQVFRGWRKAQAEGVGHQYCRKYRLSGAALIAIDEQRVQLLVYLAEADLLDLDSAERSALNSARSSYRGRQSFDVPARYNVYERDEILRATIGIATYPRILLRDGKSWRNVYTNQHVRLVSHSMVDQTTETTMTPPKWLCFTETMQARNGALTAHHASRISEATIVTLLGEAVFKFHAGAVIVDNGKMKFTVTQWHQLAALKFIRTRTREVIEQFWRSVRSKMPPADEAWLHTLVKLLSGEFVTTERVRPLQSRGSGN